MSSYDIRRAVAADCPELYKLIIKLYKHEGILEPVPLLVEDLETDGFGEKSFYRCLVIEETQTKKLVGYSVYFFTYSTSVGKSSYIEDIFVDDKYRRRGLGVSLWKAVVKDCLENGCLQSELSVLESNTSALKFYEKVETKNVTKEDKWNRFRLGKNDMINLVKDSKIRIESQ